MLLSLSSGSWNDSESKKPFLHTQCFHHCWQNHPVYVCAGHLCRRCCSQGLRCVSVSKARHEGYLPNKQYGNSQFIRQWFKKPSFLQLLAVRRSWWTWCQRPWSMVWFSVRSCCSCQTADKSMRFAELVLLSQVCSLVGAVPGLFPVIWKIKWYRKSIYLFCQASLAWMK